MQAAFVGKIAKMEEAKIRCTLCDFIDFFMMPSINDKNVTHSSFMWNDDETA